MVEELHSVESQFRFALHKHVLHQHTVFPVCRHARQGAEQPAVAEPPLRYIYRLELAVRQHRLLVRGLALVRQPPPLHVRREKAPKLFVIAKR